MSLTGETRFDVSTRSVLKYPLRSPNVKSVVIEFGPDGNGNGAGSVGVYLGEAIGAQAWRTVSINTLRVYPVPECDFVTVVAAAGALGVCTISLSQEPLGVGIFPFSRGGGGSGSTTVSGAAASPSQVQGVFGNYDGGTTQTLTATLAAPAGAGNLIVVYSAPSGGQVPPANIANANVLAQPSSAHTDLGVWIYAITAKGGEQAFKFTGVGGGYGGFGCARVEEWLNASGVTVFTSSNASLPLLVLANLTPGAVLVAAQSTYAPAAANGTLAGWTEFCSGGFNTGVGDGLDIYQTIATSSSQSYQFASTGTSGPGANGAACLFQINGAATSLLPPATNALRGALYFAAVNSGPASDTLFVCVESSPGAFSWHAL